MPSRTGIIRRPDGTKMEIPDIPNDSMMTDAIRAVFQITEAQALRIVLLTRRVGNQSLGEVFFGANWPEVNIKPMAVIGGDPVTDYLTAWWEILQDGQPTGFAVSFK